MAAHHFHDGRSVRGATGSCLDYGGDLAEVVRRGTPGGTMASIFASPVRKLSKRWDLAAVEEGLSAYEELLAKLADGPTPAGPAPRQLRCEHFVQLEVGEQPK